MVNPLFQTREELLLAIRLSTATDVQTLAVVDSAITEVRMGFFSALGTSRAVMIAGYTGSENPTTAEEILKATAKVAEGLWITARLLEQLPSLFLSESGKVRDEFNDEPLTRDSAGLAKQKKDLMVRVERLVGQLKSPSEVAGNGAVFSCGRVDINGDDDPYLIADNFIGKRL